MILVDYNGIAVGNIITQKLDLDENLIRHMILNSLRMYRKKFGNEFGELVVVSDNGGNWRKDVFPPYKFKRKDGREKSSMDWNELFRITNMVRDEIRDNFPYKVVHQYGCEADDAIAHIAYQTEEFGQHEPIMIVSADKDFAQLQTMKHVKQYSSMTKKYIVEPNPRLQLMNLILSGDGSDGVPNVLSDDFVFQEGRRQTPLSAKKKAALMEDIHALGDTVYRNYLRNKKLIDLSETPPAVIENIINNFNGQDPAANRAKVFPYLVEKRCKNLIESVQEFI
tara:strand:+ start:671 stop:1513 length:843 start_codon:yes stop_codon:yes gene_type:complete